MSQQIFIIDKIILGGNKGTHLAIGELTFEGNLTVKKDFLNLDLLAMANSSSISISGNESNNFLNNILPEKPVTANFDLGIGWSSKNGWYLKGGLDKVIIPLSKTMGPLTFQDLIQINRAS